MVGRCRTALAFPHARVGVRAFASASTAPVTAEAPKSEGKAEAPKKPIDWKDVAKKVGGVRM
jgi:hypothetical protein